MCFGMAMEEALILQLSLRIHLLPIFTKIIKANRFIEQRGKTKTHSFLKTHPS